MSSRRNGGLSLAAFVLLALFVGACGPPARPGAPPRHCVLVTVSGLRADRVAALGYPRPTTSAAQVTADGVDLSLDGLVASGVAFANAFAPAADDATSLAALLADGAKPLAESFSAAGFLTAAFVGGAAEAPELLRGFEHVARASGTGASNTDAEDPDYAAVRAAVTWLREVGEPADQPLFLWVHLSGPAAPWEPAPLGADDLRARFCDPDYAGGLDGSAETLGRLSDPAVPLDGLDLTHLANLYDAEVARAARLLEQLASALGGRFGLLPRDLLGESAVVVAGTRGVELFQHGRAAEDAASLFDASLRVPLVLRHPASLTGRRVLGELVELRDLRPTLVDWFGVAAPSRAERSLLALTDSYVERPFARAPVVARRENGGSVRTAERHLIVRGEERLLFDPARDPLERRNLAGQEPETVRELQRLLDEAP